MRCGKRLSWGPGPAEDRLHRKADTYTHTHTHTHTASHQPQTRKCRHTYTRTHSDSSPVNQATCQRHRTPGHQHIALTHTHTHTHTHTMIHATHTHTHTYTQGHPSPRPHHRHKCTNSPDSRYTDTQPHVQHRQKLAHISDADGLMVVCLCTGRDTQKQYPAKTSFKRPVDKDMSSHQHLDT